MNKNGEKTKLLAVIAVFAMVLCAMAAVMPAVDAADELTVTVDGTTEWDAYEPALTNDMIGNSALTIVKDDETNDYMITGVLNYVGKNVENPVSGSVQEIFKKDGATADYGMIYKISNIGGWLNYENSAGKWISVDKSSATSEMLKYISSETGTSTYYITEEQTTEETFDASKATAFTVSWDVTFSNNVLAEGMTVTLPDGMAMSSNGTYVTLSGNIQAASNNDTCEGTNFQTVFNLNGEADGYNFIQINSASLKNNTITQVSPALQIYYEQYEGESGVTLKDGVYTKVSGANNTYGTEYYAFLVASGEKATVTIGSTTYTFDFSDVKTGTTANDATSANDALENENISEVTIDASSASLDVSKVIKVPDNKTLVIENATTAVNFKVQTGADSDANVATFNGVTAKSITITKGSIILNGKEISTPADGNITIGAGDRLQITNGTTIGAEGLKITGTADADGKYTATVDIPRSTELELDANTTISFVGVNSNIKGTITGGTIEAGANSVVTIDGTVTSKVTNIGGGTIVNNTATVGNITLGDGAIVDSQTSVNGSISQEIIVTGDVTVIDDGAIYVKGLLTIQEGATLTLENGAELVIESTGKVVNNGTIAVEADEENADYIFTYSGSSMAVNGTLDLQGPMAFDSSKGKNITVNGTMNVGDDATANIGGLVVGSAGTLNINGQVSGSFTNNGTVNIDSEVAPAAGANVTINMRDGAVLNVENANGVYYVTDAGMTFRNSDGVDVAIDADKDASVTLTNVSGVTISESLVVKMEPAGSPDAVRVGYGNMTISGEADIASTTADANTSASIAITDGTLNVAAEASLALAADVDITIAEAGTLNVAGTVDATADSTDDSGVKSTISGDGTMTVTGTVTSDVALDGTNGVATVNAAKYETGTGSSKVYTYTTLATAIANGADKITMLGTVLIEEDITIPAGVTVDASKVASFTIADEATVTVAYDSAANSSGKLTIGSEPVVVKGTLITEHQSKSTVKDSSVESDVISKDGDYAKFTSIYNALAEAQSGETITVTKDGTLPIEKDITIPAGVVLSVPDANVVVSAGVTVTVNGTYEGDKTYTMTKGTTEDPTQTVVNGMFKLLGSTTSQQSEIAGAYYIYDGYNVISPLSVLETVMADVESNDAKVFGTVTDGDVTLTGEDFTLAVQNGAVMTVTSLTLDGVDLDFTNGRTNATVNVADAVFTLDKVKGGKITTVSATENDVTTVTAVLTGAVTTADKLDAEKELPTGAVTVSGTAQVGAVNAPTNFNAVASTNKAPAFTAAAESDVTVVGATFGGKTTVAGTVTVDDATANFNGELVVSGTVAVAEDYAANASRMLVGVSIDDKQVITDLGSGSVSGVTVATGATSVVYVSPNATFTATEAQADALVSTEFYVEDALFVTAYANTGNEIAINSVKANVENARFDAWLNADGSAVTGKYIGAPEYTEVYADITYDVYVVNIRADQNAISSISVDGNLMQFGMINGTDGNWYYGYTITVAAGNHTVQYQLANGYSGEGVLSVLSGDTTVSGMTFTTSGTPAAGSNDTISYHLQLTGFEKSGYVPDSPDTGDSDSADTGMTITDYLLIVLVVLIIVMAIIVAMRLMRS